MPHGEGVSVCGESAYGALYVKALLWERVLKRERKCINEITEVMRGM